MTLFDYHVRVRRGATDIPMTVRAETWQEAREALVSSLPENWRREGVDSRLDRIDQVVADAASAEALERRVGTLLDELAVARKAADDAFAAASRAERGRTQLQIDAEEISRREDIFGRALVKIARMDDSAGALDEAKGWARDAFTEAGIPVPGITTPLKIIIPTDSEES